MIATWMDCKLAKLFVLRFGFSTLNQETFERGKFIWRTHVFHNIEAYYDVKKNQGLSDHLKIKQFHFLLK